MLESLSGEDQRRKKEILKGVETRKIYEGIFFSYHQPTKWNLPTWKPQTHTWSQIETISWSGPEENMGGIHTPEFVQILLLNRKGLPSNFFYFIQNASLTQAHCFALCLSIQKPWPSAAWWFRPKNDQTQSQKEAA
jgi:hypothetical protein